MTSSKITKLLFGGNPTYKGATDEEARMNSAGALTSTVSELGKTFAGELLQPADPGYDDARKVHNGLIDKRPALITTRRCAADIVDAVKLAREQQLEKSLSRGGGNVAGRSTSTAAW